MTRPISRIRSILRRRRIDGRLPEQSSWLLRDLLRLRLRGAITWLPARILPPVGRAWPSRRAKAVSVPGDARRWEITGDMTMSSFDLRHIHARQVVDSLEAGGLKPFLTGASDRRIQLGLRAEDRATAWRALVSGLGSSDGWYIEWRRGSRRRTRRVSSGSPRRSMLGAEWWRLFRLCRVGDGAAAGHDEAVEVTFWAPGEHSRLERLGIRGLHRFPEGSEPTTEVVDGYRYPGVASFPIGRALTRFSEPIDLVYTWVDGNDPEWRADFEEWRRLEAEGEGGVDDTHWGRYASHDELRYSLRSVWLYAGWARRIYLVTSGQVPDWLEPDDRLVLVPHQQILPSDLLPTFNSHAIESRLHHIEGLAEHFVYFNDDVFLGRPAERSQFFTENGLVRFIEGEAWVVDDGGDPRNLAVDVAARNGRALIEATFGRVVEHKLAHVPHALRRSILFELEERFPDQVKATSGHRFRHQDDIAIASGFAQHYAFCTGRAVPGEMRYLYRNLESGRLPLALERLRLGRDMDTFCLNQTEATGADPSAAQRSLTRFLTSYFAVPSPWEREQDSTR